MDANHPRQNEWCTLGSEDRLKLAYNIYKPMVEKQTAESNNLPLNLVFVHGAGMCKEIWEDMIGRFFDNFPEPLGKVITVDLITHGESYRENKEKLGWSYPWSDGGRDVIKLLNEEIGLDSGPTFLIGSSMGATQCVYASFFSPALVDGLILLDPVAYTSEELRLHPKGQKFMHQSTVKLNQGMQNKFTNWDEYEKFMRKRYFSKSFDPNVQENFIQNSVRKNDEDGTLEFTTPSQYHMLSYYNSTYITRDDQALKIYSMIDCPVIHIVGTGVSFNFPDAVPKIREALPKGREFADIPDGGHLFAFEYPKESFDAILPFVTKNYYPAADRKVEWKKRQGLDSKQRAELFMEKYNELANSYPANKMYSKL